MWVHGFDMYRVFISAPGDLERERDTCRRAISDINEQMAMPQKILLVSVGLMEDGQIVGFRSVVGENIRQCTFFVQVFQDDWGPNNLFRKMFFLGTDCRDDSSFPMREVIVCLKDAARETDPNILEFRKELEETPGVRVLRFDTLDRLKEQLLEACRGWVSDVVTAAAQGATPCNTAIDPRAES